MWRNSTFLDKIDFISINKSMNRPQTRLAIYDYVMVDNKLSNQSDLQCRFSNTNKVRFRILSSLGVKIFLSFKNHPF